MVNGQLGHALETIRKQVALQHNGTLPDHQLLEAFVGRQDGAAFGALLHRHGPMVLNVCRRVLKHVQDAEDACQATFLILAQRAATIRKRDSLASWVHAVACRVAKKLQADLARRRSRARPVRDLCEADTSTEVSWREVQSVIDEELTRLPETYRAPLLLCYLEGRTQDEAARQLRWALGVFRGRLDRGRERLRARLVRRGITLSGALLSTALTQTGACAAVPATLIVSTARAATLIAAGKGTATGGLPAHVVALVEGVSKAMMMAKLRIAAVVVLALTVVGGGLGVFALPVPVAGQEEPGCPLLAEKDQQVQRKDPSKRELEKLQGTWTLVNMESQGRELDCQGKPFNQLRFAGKEVSQWNQRGEKHDSSRELHLDTRKRPSEFTVSWSIIGWWGIYKLDGDELTLCFRYADPGRPTSFTTKPGSANLLLVYKRDPEKSADADMQKLQGDWTLVETQKHGKRTEPKTIGIEPHRIAITGARVTKKDITGRDIYSGSIELDTKARPKQITVTWLVQWLGVYELSGDTLRICSNPANGIRPTDFTMPADSERVLFVYKRERPMTGPVTNPKDTEGGHVKNVRQVVGRVLDDAGKPVEGASVFLVGSGHVRIWRGKAVGWLPSGDEIPPDDKQVPTAITDRHGQFTLAGPEASAKEAAVSCRMLDLWVVPVPEKDKELTIRLPQPARLVIRYDIEGADAEARLHLDPSARGYAEVLREPRVPNKGQVILEDLAPGQYELTRIRLGSLCDRRTVVLGPGERVESHFIRERGQRVEGRVVGIDLTKMGTRVRVLSGKATGDPRAYDEFMTVYDAFACDADGKFVTERLSPGAYTIAAEAYLPLTTEQHTNWGSLPLPHFTGVAKVTVAGDKPPEPVRIEMKPYKESDGAKKRLEEQDTRIRKLDEDIKRTLDENDARSKAIDEESRQVKKRATAGHPVRPSSGLSPEP